MLAGNSRSKGHLVFISFLEKTAHLEKDAQVKLDLFPRSSGVKKTNIFNQLKNISHIYAEGFLFPNHPESPSSHQIRYRYLIELHRQENTQTTKG